MSKLKPPLIMGGNKVDALLTRFSTKDSFLSSNFFLQLIKQNLMYREYQELKDQTLIAAMTSFL